MKKRITALMFCVTLALAGCGSTSSGGAVATEPKEVAAAADVSATEPEKVEEPKVETPKVEEVKKPEETEKTEEPKEESTEATKTETASEPKEAEVVEVAKTDETTGAANESVAVETVQATEPTYNTIIEKYIADGDFTDFAAYGTEIGATRVWFDPEEWNIVFYFDSFVVTVGTNVQDSEWTYVGIKETGDDDIEYACLVAYNGVPIVPVSSSGTFIPVDTAMKLEQTINYLKQHPDTTQKPDIPGMTWQKWSDLVG